MKLVRSAAAALPLLLAAPTLAQAADEQHPQAPDPAAQSIDRVKHAPGTYWPEWQPEFDMMVAFGDDAMGGVGQCGNPSDRGSGRCRLRLAEGGPAVLDADLPSTVMQVIRPWVTRST